MTGQRLAEELGVSLRTLYRDIATLQAQGAPLEGEPGLGYVLRPGFLLPPLMFSDDEIEALVLGSRWVASGVESDTSANGYGFRADVRRARSGWPPPARVCARRHLDIQASRHPDI
jgi:predicted DNA-binding transcriptional regulator YafY